MSWVKLQLSLLPYRVAWFGVVVFSIIYTLRGMQAIFPGKDIFTYMGETVTETHLLGLALCLGQYTTLSISFNLIGTNKKLQIRDKIMASIGLLLGVALTIGNTTFAFKAINISKDSFNVDISAVQGEITALEGKIQFKEATWDKYNDQLKLLDSDHSTNIRKMSESIRPDMKRIESEIEQLLSTKIELESKLSAMSTEKEVNTNFSFSGMDGSKLISGIMSIALDPIAIIIMLSMQSLKAHYWEHAHGNLNINDNRIKLDHLAKTTSRFKDHFPKRESPIPPAPPEKPPVREIVEDGTPPPDNDREYGSWESEPEELVQVEKLT